MTSAGRTGSRPVTIVVDTDRCQGHARCHTSAPDLFVLDDDGYNQTRETDVPPGREEEARLGAAYCPEHAIRIVE